MLEVSTSVCVLMLGRPLLVLLLLAILCHVPLPSLLSRVPHAMFGWDQALFLCACCLSVSLLGCYPVLLLLWLLELTWMLPGSLLRCHVKTKAADVDTLLQLLLYAPFVLLARKGRPGSRPSWSKMLNGWTLAQLCWDRVLILNILHIYVLRGPLASLNGISVNLAELFLKLQGLFLNVFRTIPKICIYI